MTQNLATIRSSPNEAAAAVSVDAMDDLETSDRKASCHKPSDQSGVEVVCGPVELAKYMDLSGTQGILPLTSTRLLKVKSKSFLVRFKSKPSRGEKTSATADKPTQVNMLALAASFLFVSTGFQVTDILWHYVRLQMKFMNVMV